MLYASVITKPMYNDTKIPLHDVITDFDCIYDILGVRVRCIQKYMLMF